MNAHSHYHDHRNFYKKGHAHEHEHNRPHSLDYWRDKTGGRRLHTHDHRPDPNDPFTNALSRAIRGLTDSIKNRDAIL